jgi:mannose-6-phosphate isomerase-like protein (cupin superfamily)
MTIIREQDAPRFGQDGVEVTGLASPSRGCDTVSAWRVLLQPGAASPEHTLTSDEAFIALRGSARVELEGASEELRAGDCLVVAPERRFSIRNDASVPFEAVCCMAAGGQAVVEGEGSFVPPWAA